MFDRLNVQYLSEDMMFDVACWQCLGIANQ